MFTNSVVSGKRRREKSGAVQLCTSMYGACSTDHSSRPYESVRTTLKRKWCGYHKIVQDTSGQLLTPTDILGFRRSLRYSIYQIRMVLQSFEVRVCLVREHGIYVRTYHTPCTGIAEAPCAALYQRLLIVPILNNELIRYSEDQCNMYSCTTAYHAVLHELRISYD